MTRWLTYARERWSLFSCLLISGGFVASGTRIWGVGFGMPGVVVAFFGLFLLFVMMHIMDDLRSGGLASAAQGRTARAQPLPDEEAAHRAVIALMASLLLLSGGIFAFISSSAGRLLAGSALYLWLVYRDFYLGLAQAERPLLATASQVVVMIPLALFASYVHDATAIFGSLAIFRTPPHPREALIFGIAVAAVFFIWDVCRDVTAEARKGGPKSLARLPISREIAAIALASAVTFSCGVVLGIWPYLIFFEAATLLSLWTLRKQAAHAKIIATTASLSLLVHLYGGVLIS